MKRMGLRNSSLLVLSTMAGMKMTANPKTVLRTVQAQTLINCEQFLLFGITPGPLQG